MEFRRNGRRYTWTQADEDASRAQHGVSFRLAARVFDQDLYLEGPAPGRRQGARVAIGPAAELILTVVHQPRPDGARILSARRATAVEARWYEQEAH